jgi:hypothetical protein
MNKWSSRVEVAAVALSFLIVAAGFAAQAAEAKDVTYTKRTRQTVSETKANPGHPATGELAQQVFLDTAIETPADFPVSEIWVYNQDNTVAGSGVHRGYEVHIFKNGDMAYTKYEGTHQVITKDGGAWEVTYQGTQSYVGGTGRYKDIRGPGTYKGRITPDSFQEQNKWNASY